MKASSKYNFTIVGTDGLVCQFVFKPEKKEIHIQYTDLINNSTKVIAEDKRVISHFEHSLEAIQKGVSETIRSSFIPSS